MDKKLTIIERIFQNRILTHVLFWLSTLIIFPIYGMGLNISFAAGFIIKIFFLPIQIAATYYLIYYQIPTFVYTKRYTRFFISLGLSAIVFCTLAHFSEDFGLAKILRGYTNNIHTFWEIISNPFGNIGYNAEDIYLTVFIATGIKFIKQILEEKRELTLLEREKTTAEISLLKAQINPRILSKTLHQLHQLTKEKSDAAPEVVIKLSDILDYMLYQCNTPKVLIRNEIDLVQNYLDLEKLRFGDALTINFYHSLDNQFSEITPLLLLSLVESAFGEKEATLPPNAMLEILLREKNGQLHCELSSNLTNEVNGLADDFKKQLALLYSAQYELTITEKEQRYALDLVLTL